MNCKQLTGGRRLALVLLGAGLVQGEPLQPTRTIDLFAISEKLFGRKDLQLFLIAENAGRWAAVLRVAKQDMVVVSGSLDDVNYATLTGSFSAMVIDGNGIVTLAENNRRGVPTYTTDWEPATNRVIRGVVPYGALPFLSEGKSLWRTSQGVFDRETRTLRPRILSNLTGQPQVTTVDDGVNETRYLVGLKGGRFATVGCRSEQISLYGADGAIESSVTADVAAAYDALGVDHTKHPSKFERIETGSLRLGWAVATPNDEILVFLGQVPVSKFPGPLAAFDANSGKFLRFIHLETPQAAVRRNKWNPRGSTTPFRGAFGSVLFTVDPLAGLGAFYQIKEIPEKLKEIPEK